VRKVTVSEVMAWGPCELYTRERVTELFNGGDMLTAWDISVLDIPIEDRIWALLHEEFFSNSDLRMMSCAFAERVLGIYERKYPGDYRPREAIRVSRLFAMGDATLEDLKTAEVAAWAAADAATYVAAEAVTWAAAKAAAMDAVEASWAAVKAAEWAKCYTTGATSDAAKYAERCAQLEIIKLYLGDYDENSNY
jgi:hypothetical protein